MIPPTDRETRLDLLDEEQLAQLESHLKRLISRFQISRALPDLHAAMGDFVLRGGKRLRPQLCIWTSLRAGRSELDDPLLDMACVWELFHAFLLVHDDLIDDSDSRRGRPSLHRSLSAIQGCSASGRHLAIVAGDLLFTESIRLLHELDLSADTHRRLLRLFSSIAATTGAGQAIDICQTHAAPSALDEASLLSAYDCKTAAYTFEGPMLSGAILAGLDDASLAPLRDFARLLGQAYQIHNDLKDLSSIAQPGCDLAQGKRTAPVAWAREAMDPTDRGRLDDALLLIPEANGEALGLAENVRLRLLEAGVVGVTRRRLDSILDDAAQAAESMSQRELRSAVAALQERLRSDYFSRL